MALSLSTAEERRIASVSEALLSPLDHGSFDVWSRRMLAEAKALVGCDRGAVFVPVEGTLVIGADAPDVDGLAEQYVPRTRPLHTRLQFLRRAVELGAYDRPTLFRPYFDQYLRSPYYNEWIVPNRLFDTIGLAVAPEPGIGPDTIAQLALFNERPQAGLGTREAALLGLVLPSFRAAVHAWRSHAFREAALPRTLDGLRQPLLLCDATGRPVHWNAALERVLATDPEAVRIRTALEELARALARFRASPTDRMPPRTTRPLGTAHARYEAYATCSESGELLPGLGILVGLERTSPDWPTPGNLARRFGLTPAQARVALLLARGKTNAEIAGELTISPATARNHTARVREKLGVESRARVAAVVLSTETD